jgi:hypothetical protein
MRILLRKYSIVSCSVVDPDPVASQWIRFRVFTMYPIKKEKNKQISGKG